MDDVYDETFCQFCFNLTSNSTSTKNTKITKFLLVSPNRTVTVVGYLYPVDIRLFLVKVTDFVHQSHVSVDEDQDKIRSTLIVSDKHRDHNLQLDANVKT